MANLYPYDTETSGVAYFKTHEFLSMPRDRQQSILKYYADEIGADRNEVVSALMPEPSEEDLEWSFGSALKSGLIQNEMLNAKTPEETAFFQRRLEATARPGNFLQDTVGAVFSTPLALGLENSLAIPALASAGPLGIAAAGMLTGVSSGKLQKQSLGMEMAASEYGIDTTDPEQMRELYENPELMKEISDKTRWGATAVGALDAASVGLSGQGLSRLMRKKIVSSTTGKQVGDIAYKYGAATRAVAPAAGEFVQQGAFGGGGEALSQLATHGEITDVRGILLEIGAEGIGGIGEVPGTYLGYLGQRKLTMNLDDFNTRVKNAGTRVGNVAPAQQRAAGEDLLDIHRQAAAVTLPKSSATVREALLFPKKHIQLQEVANALDMSVEEALEIKNTFQDNVNQIHKERYKITAADARAIEVEMTLDPVFMSTRMKYDIGESGPQLPVNDVQAAVIGVLQDRGVSGFLVRQLVSRETGNKFSGIYDPNHNSIFLDTSNPDDLFYSAAVHELMHALDNTGDQAYVKGVRKFLLNLVPLDEQEKIFETIQKGYPLDERSDEVLSHLAEFVIKSNPKAVFDAFMAGMSDPAMRNDSSVTKAARHLSDFALDFMKKFKHLDSITEGFEKFSTREEIDSAGITKVIEAIGKIKKFEKPVVEPGPAPVVAPVVEPRGPKQIALDKTMPGHGFEENEITLSWVRITARKEGMDVVKTVNEYENAVSPKTPKRDALDKVLPGHGLEENQITLKVIKDMARKRGIQIKKTVDGYKAELIKPEEKPSRVASSKAVKYETEALELVLPGHNITPDQWGAHNEELIKAEAKDRGLNEDTIIEEIWDVADQLEEADVAGNILHSFKKLSDEGGLDPTEPDSNVGGLPERVDRANGKVTFGEYIGGLIDSMLQTMSKAVPFFNVKTFDEARAKFQDRFLAVRRLQEAAMTAGINISQFLNVYVGEANMRGRQEYMWKKFETEVIDPVNRKVKSLNLDPRDIQNFLESLHAPERNLRVYSLFKDTKIKREDIKGSGLSDGESIRMLRMQVDRGLLDFDLDEWARAYGYLDEETMSEATEWREQQKAHARAEMKWREQPNSFGAVHIKPNVTLIGKMAVVREEMNKLIGAQRSLLATYGLANETDIRNIILTFEYYAPLRGTLDPFVSDERSVGQFLDIRGKDVQTPLGRESRTPNDIYTQLISDIERIIIRGEKNLVGNRFYNLARKVLEVDTHNTLGIQEILTVNPKKWAIKNVSGEDLGTTAINERDPTAKVIQINDIFFKTRPNVFATKIDGQVKYVVMNANGEALATALKALGSEVVGPVIAFHAKIQRQLARMSTSLNLDFAIANIIRDGLQASAFAHTGEVEGSVGDFLDAKKLNLARKAIWDFDRMGGVSPSLEGRSAEQVHWDNRIRQLGEFGGRTGWMQATDLDALNKKYEKRAIKTRVNEKGYIVHVNPFAEGLALVETVTGVTEAIFRVISFDEAIKSGMNEEASANMARNLTVDFNKRGNSIHLSMMYIFANASIQGTTRFLRALTKNKKVQRLVMQLAGVSFGMAMWNRNMMDEDEWDAIPDHMKERSLLISLGGNNLVEIPLPWGFNVFHVLGTQMEGIAFGNKTVNDMARTLSTAMISSFNPLGGTFGHSMYGNLRNFVPTVPRIAMDIAANESWTGTPIHTEYGIKGAPGHTKGREGTAKPFAWGSQALNYITGGNEVDKGFVSVYPEDIEYLIKNSFGGLGSLFNNVVKTGGDIGSWFGDDPQGIDTRHIPILRRLTAKYSPEYNLDIYFKESDKLKLVTSNAEKALEAHDLVEYNRIKKKFPEYMNKATIKAFRNAEKRRRSAKTIEEQGKVVRSATDLVQK